MLAKRFFGVLALCGFLAACGKATEGTVAEDASLSVYHGGNIITMVGDEPAYVEAVVVEAGRIVYVGELEGAKRQYQSARQIDLQGKTLVPGFIDGHMHFAYLGAQAIGARLLAPPDGGVETIDDLIAELKRFAGVPDVKYTGWVFGTGYDDATLKEGRHPTRDDLDKVSTEAPVIAVHISGHVAAVNSVALKMLGYTTESENPKGGVIRRRPGSQEPNGVLEETAAFPAIFTGIMPTTEEGQLYFMKRAQEFAASMGQTTVQEGRALKGAHEQLVKAAEEGLLKVDVVSYIDYTDKELIDTKWYGREYRKRYRIGGLKITLDGSPQGRTAWTTEPYLIPPEGQEKGYRGYPAIADDKIVEGLYDEAFKKGWQVLTHANGDAAADQMIRTMRPVLDKYGAADRRHVFIHGQFARQDQLDACKELGIIPSLFPMHTFYWGDWYDKIIGPERAQRISPIKSALKRGMIVTSHSDSPVALPNLMRVMNATVNRTSRSGKVMGPDERLTPLEALKAITIWSAYSHFEEDSKGSIEVGKLADLVVLSDNPLTVPPATIGDITVRETIKEGKTIYRAAH